MDSMFANDIVDGEPKCPLCEDLISPGTSEAYSTPTGLWIIHKSCADNYNARNTPGAVWS